MTEATLPPVGLFEDFCVDDPAVLRGYAEAMYDHLNAVGPGGSDERFTRDDLRRGTIWLVGCYHTFDLPPCVNALRLVAAFVEDGLSGKDAERRKMREMYPMAADSGIPNALSWPAYERALILEAENVRPEHATEPFAASSWSVAKALVDEGLLKKTVKSADDKIRGWRKRDHYEAMVRMLREHIYRNWTP